MITVDDTRRPMKVIEVFADVVCPFTHVGLKRLTAYRNEVGRDDVVFEVHAWPLELVNGELVPRELLVEEVAELRAGVAPELFAGFDPTLFPMTSLHALALAARAYRVSLRRGEHVSLALRDALFEHGRNISDPDELAAIASSCEIEASVDIDEAAVIADLQRGRARAVIGSPHFFIEDDGFFCPTLDIERVGTDLRIAMDPTSFTAFVEKCFGPETH
jgi:predicted DsbA family dithiol-disulfide isomerase